MFHEDATDTDMNKPGPGYDYQRDVALKGVPYKTVPGLSEVVNQFSKECGVP